MITRLKLVIAQFKMRLLLREIADTSSEYADAVYVDDFKVSAALRLYSFDLCRERTRLAAHIQFLNSQLKARK